MFIFFIVYLNCFKYWHFYYDSEFRIACHTLIKYDSTFTCIVKKVYCKSIGFLYFFKASSLFDENFPHKLRNLVNSFWNLHNIWLRFSFRYQINMTLTMKLVCSSLECADVTICIFANYPLTIPLSSLWVGPRDLLGRFDSPTLIKRQQNNTCKQILVLREQWRHQFHRNRPDNRSRRKHFLLNEIKFKWL